MYRRSLLVCGVTSLLAGCLARVRGPSVSESTIEACEVAYLEAERFDDDAPSIDASVTAVERYDDTYQRVTVESRWLLPGVNVLEITLEPVDSDPPADAPSTGEPPLTDLESFHELLEDILEADEEYTVETDHEAYTDIRNALLETFDIEESTDEQRQFPLEHDGEHLTVSLWLEELHGDGEEEAIYFVSETDTYRVDEYDGKPADGTPMSCPTDE